MQRIGGSRRKSRYKLQKEKRCKGKLSLTRYLQKFEAGEKVSLVGEPSVQSGMYHTRFFGKMGIIKSQVGRCYEVLINDHKKEKMLIVHPIHLRKN